MLVATVSSHAYIAPGELESWVAEKTGRLQDEMRDAMDMSNKRADAKQALSLLKADIQGAKTAEDWKAAREALQKFIDKHKGDPEYQTVIGQAAGIKNKIDDCFVTLGSETGGSSATEVPKLLFGGLPSDDDKEKWADKLQAAADRMGSTDQLALLQIQNLNSQACQALQQASGLASSYNQCSMVMISNTRA